MAAPAGGLNTLPNGNPRMAGGGSAGPTGNDWENYNKGNGVTPRGGFNGPNGNNMSGGNMNISNSGQVASPRSEQEIIMRQQQGNQSTDPRISGIGDGMRHGQPMPDGSMPPPAMYANQPNVGTTRQPQPQGFNINEAAAQGIQGALGTTAAETGYRPMAIGAPSQANLQQYTNPYESQVVQQSLADLERSRLMAQNVGGAQASAANSFGGSRQGIAESETNRAYADQAARTASGLRQAGYQNAQDMARQASMANQTAGLQGSQQRLGAAGQLGSLSNLGFGMGQTIQGNMDRQGMMQQALQQQLINEAKGQYQGFTGAPQQSLQALLAAVGGAPNVGSQTSGYSPGLFDYLSLGMGMG
jgi:hypothetical protein